MKSKTNKNSFIKVFKILLTIILSILLILTLLVVGYFIKLNNSIDYSADEKLFELSRGSRTTTLYYNDKTKLSTELEANIGLNGYFPKELDSDKIYGAENGIWCAYDDIPDNLKNAFVAIEDHRFFSHKGVDVFRTGKAVLNYLLHFDSRFGGSTITQQLVKNISSDNEISVERKLREMLRAINIERKFSKEEILELYLNIVPMSENCVGIFSGAEVYFSKEPSELSLIECAALTAIINSPSRYNPIENPENNAIRRDIVLEAMLSYGYISQSEFGEAYGKELTLNVNEKKDEQVYSWYAETVIDDVIKDLMTEKGMSYETASKTVYSGGLKIYTLMDKNIQDILDSYFSNYYNFPKACRTNSLQYAMTVVSPSGDLLGVVGAVGEKNANRVMNFATKSQMPPGSSIKPLSVYGPALEEGLISWSTVFDDTPVSFYRGKIGYIAWPQNFPSVYSGLTDISTAVAYSKNTVAVKVYNKLGAERAYDYLVNKLHINGIVRSSEYNGEKYTDLASAPLALGQLSFGATLRDMTNAYTSFYDGNYHKSRTYLAVYDSLGNLLLENKEEKSYVFSEQNAAIMTQLLQNVVSFGTANKINLKYSIDTAGKTGTSGEDRDRWFIGYTPYYTAGIWCGYPERDGSVGDIAPTHLEIWDAVMRKIHREVFNQGESIKNFEIPYGVVRAQYCRDSGKLFCDTCSHDPRGSRASTGYFLKSNMPRTYCDRHILVDYDEENGGVLNVGENTEGLFEDGEDIKIKKVALLREYGRDFPAQLYISDAQYIYRELNGEKASLSDREPFFAPILPKGRYIGISNTKGGKQFNSYRHIPEDKEKQEEDDLENPLNDEREASEGEAQEEAEMPKKDGIFDEE